MPVLTKTFDELLTYSRDSGATRVNAAGLIVGVDFSTTSVTFGTGAKTFTLAADANVNRDWPVGSRVRATSQASPLGLMNGTVTSYNPATQELVINVTESTGTGTGTNWRIGSLEFRRDFDSVTLAAKGGLVEAVGATNLVFPSETATTQTRTVVSGQVYTLSFYGTGSVVLSGAATGTETGNGAYPAALKTRTFKASSASLTMTVTGSVLDMQLELGILASSRIPTTTVAVTRAADLLAVDGSNFSQAYNQSEGTLLLECIPTASVSSGAIASINDGTLNNEIRAGIKQSGTTSSIRAIASDGVNDILGLSATGNNILRSNGIDYTEADTGQVANGLAVASAGVGQFIVGGTNGFYSITNNGGASWTNFQLDVADRAQLNGAAFGNDVYVLVGNAVGGSGLIVTVDPVTGAYARRTFPINSNINNVRFLNGAFYACSAGMYRSLDGGVTWLSAGSATVAMLDVAFGNGTFISTRSIASGVFVSANGNSFDAQTVITGFPGGIIRSADFANGCFVFVGSLGGIATSLDNGATFALRTSGTTENLFAVHYSTRDQQWYAAGDNGTILRAVDPTGTWENISNDALSAVVSGGVVQSNPFLPNLIPNQINTIEMRMKANDFAVSVNGEPFVTDNSGVMPNGADRLTLGANGLNQLPINGHIRKIIYKPSVEV